MMNGVKLLNNQDVELLFSGEGSVLKIDFGQLEFYGSLHEAIFIRDFLDEFIDTFIYTFTEELNCWYVLSPWNDKVAMFSSAEFNNAKERACCLANELTVALHKGRDDK
jgi:hypothetical protein